MNEIQLIETSALLAQNPEDYLELLTRLRFFKECVKSAESALEARGLELIDQFGPIESGGMLYVAGEDRKHKPQLPPPEFAAGLLEDLGGDWEAFARCLKADAFKHGQTRCELEAVKHAERFERYFKLVITRGVEEKPLRRVKQIDTAFLKKSA